MTRPKGKQRRELTDLFKAQVVGYLRSGWTAERIADLFRRSSKSDWPSASTVRRWAQSDEAK